MKRHKKKAALLATDYGALYREIYAPAFQAIDLLLKTMERPLTVAEAAGALHMPPARAVHIMRRENIHILDKFGFLALMRLGDSPLCGLYQRELTRGVKAVYSAQDIAYIYGLDEGHVRGISAQLGHQEWPSEHVHELLAHVPVFIMRGES